MTENRQAGARWHRLLRPVVAAAIGLALALYVYERVSDPLPRQQRLQEEAAVFSAREILAAYVALGRDLEIVDPLNKNRVAGKVYIYPIDNGWQVSGHYRRAGETRWQPWLMTLDGQRTLIELSVADAALHAKAAQDPQLTIIQSN